MFVFSRSGEQTFQNRILQKLGRKFQFGIMTATIAVYPIGSLLLNGPLLNYSFPHFHKIDRNLPQYLQKIVDEVQIVLVKFN